MVTGLPRKARPEAPSTLGHDTVRAVLPRLRRHAYVLTGDRDHADRTVVACLQALQAEPERLRQRHIRFDLFRLFHDVVEPPPAPKPAPESGATTHRDKDGTGDPLRQLDALSPAQRRMLALVAVEGFSVGEGAALLRLDIPRAADLLASARRRLISGGPRHDPDTMAPIERTDRAATSERPGRPNA